MAGFGVSAAGALRARRHRPLARPRRGTQARRHLARRHERQGLAAIRAPSTASKCRTSRASATNIWCAGTRDFSFEPWLLESWETSDDARDADAACAQGHHLVERRHLQRRRRRPQSRRAGATPASRAIRSPRAWARWSMPDTKKVVDGGIERVDDYTVQAQPAEARHLADRRHGRLSGADHAPQL